MPLGPVMLDLQGCALTPEDERRLRHPATGGVILFSRNYENPQQLAELTAAIHALRSPPLLIAVDQEGGRVQRFREGFTRLPPMRSLGRLWDRNPHRARILAEQTGYVLAAELRASGVDFSFAPVLDLDYGVSTVIGDRAFHAHPDAVAELAKELVRGLRRAGMAAVGKHFPGHGFVVADSHVELPTDERKLSDLALADLVPFRRLMEHGLPAIMPAHVVYSAVDTQPAGFSEVWLKRILREELGFDGAVFSDDLSMAGAACAGEPVARARAALAAGCDMVLVCNDCEAADALLDELDFDLPAVSLARLARMHGRSEPASWVRLRQNPDYLDAVRAVSALAAEAAELSLLPDPTSPSGGGD